MPFVLYNNILLSPISEYSGVYRTTTDESQTDHVYTTLDVSGQFEVCGQVEVLGLDDAPVSYQDTGAVVGLRDPDAGDGSIGDVGAAVRAAPKTTDSDDRQKGAAATAAGGRLAWQDFVRGGDKVTDVKSPAYAFENRKVRKLRIGPARPVTTWNLIWPKLTQNRAQLIVFEGNAADDNDVIAFSPPNGFHCDAKNGPVPTILGVTHAQGDDPTFYVQWACKTYLSVRTFKNVDTRYGDPATFNDPLLSNRWTMRHEIVDGGYTDVHVEGTAIFDVGMLHHLEVNPDWYRPDLMLPVPQGFERQNIVVECSEDMSTLTYSFVDHQVPVMFPAGVYENVVDIQTDHQQYINCDKSLLQAAANIIDTNMNRINTGLFIRSMLREGGGKKKRRSPTTGGKIGP